MSETEKCIFEYRYDYKYERSQLYEDEQEGCKAEEPSDSQKHKSDDKNSRFASLAKHFKSQEHCDSDIDQAGR